MLRLSRIGRSNAPHFSVVVTEKTNPVTDGNVVEKVGIYSPKGKNPEFRFQKERVDYWLSKGAMVSETLARLLKKNGISGMERFVNFSRKFQVKKKEKKEETEIKPETSQPVTSNQ